MTTVTLTIIATHLIVSLAVGLLVAEAINTLVLRLPRRIFR